MTKTKEVTPLGKMIWEQRLFELSNNWKAADLIRKKISKYLERLKEGEPNDDEKIQYEGAILSM